MSLSRIKQIINEELRKFTILDYVDEFLDTIFYGDVKYRDIINSCDLAKGNCSDVSEELYDFLLEKGFDENRLSIVELKLPKFNMSNAHPEILKTEYLHHDILKIDDIFIDLTGSQFGNEFSGIKIYNQKQIRNLWGSVKPVLKENLNKILTEVGEANLAPFKLNLNQNTSKVVEYSFLTNTNIYHIEFHRIKEHPFGYWNIWNGGFSVGRDRDFEKIVNEGDMYRVMSTVATAFKHFFHNHNPNGFVIEPTKTEFEDERRMNLYKAYLKRELNNYPQYVMYADEEYIFLIKKGLPTEEVYHLQIQVEKYTTSSFFMSSIYEFLDDYLNKFAKGDDMLHAEKMLAKDMDNMGNNNDTNVKTNVNEVGEANITPYQWVNTNELYMQKTQRGIYRFDTDDGLKYQVDFQRPDVREPNWRVDFAAHEPMKGSSKLRPYTDTSTNRGEPLKIMSTITQIVKDFAVKMNPQLLEIHAAKEKSPEDERRLRLYGAFIERNLPEGYKVKREKDYLIVYREKMPYFEVAHS